MAVTIDSAIEVSPGVWQLTWSSNLANPEFYVYRNSYFQYVTESTSAQFRADADGQLLVEILDEINKPLVNVYPGKAFLQWYTDAQTATYRVERWTGSAWETAELIPNRGEWLLSWTSPLLPDSQAFSYRIVPIGLNGNDGTPQAFTGFMVRVPDVPVITYSYSSPNLTIQAG